MKKALAKIAVNRAVWDFISVVAQLEGKPEVNVLPIRVIPRELDVVQRYE